MHVRRPRPLAALSATALLALGLAACSENQASSGATSAETGSTSAETGAAAEQEVTVEDNHGTQTVTTPPQRVIATDNRTFETLDDWGIELVAAPVNIMPTSVSYIDDADIVNLGSHTEPNLEAVVATEPDLIVNGQRFAQYRDDLAALAPQAAVIELDPRDGEPFDAELRRQVTTLGEVFGKTAEADALVAEFDDAIARVKDAYQPDETVMAVITSGGNINYSAPGTGRTLGPVFDILGLTPALAADGSTDHQGDDISVEAIAQSNPDWILVLDRDAGTQTGTQEEAYLPANELLADSAALQNVTAVQQGQIVYMPQDTYTNESIQTYTEFFSTFADALEK